MANDIAAGVAAAPPWVGDLLRALGSVRTRRTIAAIDRHGTCQLSDLLASVRRTGEARRGRVAADLHHIRLPRLDDVGLIDYADRVVRKADHQAWDAEVTHIALGYDTAHVDGLIGCMADPGTRLVCAALEDAPRPVPLAELADTIPDAEGAPGRTLLHHHHVPALERRDLLEYDPESRLIHYFGDPLVTDILEGIARLPCSP